jgi:hypothetical protein
MSGTSTEDSPAGVSAPEMESPMVAPSSIMRAKVWQASRRRAAL